MTDSFMHKHQSALDSFMESKAIQDLEDAGIYPVPDNDVYMYPVEEIHTSYSCDYEEEEIEND